MGAICGWGGGRLRGFEVSVGGLKGEVVWGQVFVYVAGASEGSPGLHISSELLPVGPAAHSTCLFLPKVEIVVFVVLSHQKL